MASALTEKAANFTIRDVPTLQVLLDIVRPTGHVWLQPEEADVQRQSEELESHSFELVMKKLTYDANLWRVHKSKMESPSPSCSEHSQHEMYSPSHPRVPQPHISRVKSASCRCCVVQQPVPL